MNEHKPKSNEAILKSIERGVLTTGDISQICQVAPRTVARWFDDGGLVGYKIPGSRDRRVPVNNLISFMKKHNIPTGCLMGPKKRILIIENEEDIADVMTDCLKQEFSVENAKNLFAAGIIAGRFRPHIILLSLDLPANMASMIKYMKSHPDLQLTKIIGMATRLEDEDLKGLLDYVLQKPFHMRNVLEAIEETTLTSSL